jgi:hypothetical protein
MAVEGGEVADIKVANVAHVTNVDEAGKVNVAHVAQVHVVCLLPWLLHLLGVIHSGGCWVMARKNECRAVAAGGSIVPYERFRKARLDIVITRECSLVVTRISPGDRVGRRLRKYGSCEWDVVRRLTGFLRMRAPLGEDVGRKHGWRAGAGLKHGTNRKEKGVQ